MLPFIIPTLVDDAFAADWYSTSWEYRKKIEISLNSEISSDLSNFPVLVSVTDSDFIKATESDDAELLKIVAKRVKLEQQKIDDAKAAAEAAAEEAKAKVSANKKGGALPKGFEPKPEPKPEPAKSSRGTLPKGF